MFGFLGVRQRNALSLESAGRETEIATRLLVVLLKNKRSSRVGEVIGQQVLLCRARYAPRGFACVGVRANGI